MDNSSYILIMFSNYKPLFYDIEQDLPFFEIQFQTSCVVLVSPQFVQKEFVHVCLHFVNSVNCTGTTNPTSRFLVLLIRYVLFHVLSCTFNKICTISRVIVH